MTVVNLGFALEQVRQELGLAEPRFQLGEIRFTPGAEAAISQRLILEVVARHQCGDWGLLPDDDKEQNESMIVIAGRVMSAYPIDKDKPSEGHGENTIWVITDKIGVVTTVLLPDEY